MAKYRVQILHGVNGNNFEPLQRQFNLFIFPFVTLRDKPTEVKIYDTEHGIGSYTAISHNIASTIPVVSGVSIIDHPYEYLDMVILMFRDVQCHSKTNQYRVSFIKVLM